MKKFMLSFILVFSILFVSFPSQSVYASDGASTCDVGDDVVATSAYRVKSKTPVADTYGSWIKLASCVNGATEDGQELSGSVTVTWSNSISGSLSSTSKKGLTATMGFDVTKSITVQAGYSTPLSYGDKAELLVRPKYSTYSCKLERKYASSTTTYWKTVSGTYTAKKYACPDYYVKFL